MDRLDKTYYPNHANVDHSPPVLSEGEIVAKFRDAIQDAGLEPPEVIEPGKWHRFQGHVKGPQNNAGWCFLFEDGKGGTFGDWSTDLKETWFVNSNAGKSASPGQRKLAQQEAARAKKKWQEEEAARHAQATTEAQAIWDQAQPALEWHSYLKQKRIKPHNFRATANGELLAPVYDRDGKLSSVQRIFEKEGKFEKRFLSGGATGDDRHFVIGGPDEHLSGATEGMETIYIAEGVATAASIHEATGYPAVVAFSANKLEPVATLARERYPEAKIVICADNDAETEAKGKGNPGIEAATKAAQAVGAYLAIPPALESKSMDFNDLAVTKGMDAVKETILDALKSRDLLPKKNQYVPSRPRKSHQPSQASAVSIWEKASSAIDSLVETYLRSCGLTIPIPFSIRFHPSLYASQKDWPCMVAQVQDGVTGKPLGIHRTFLDEDGSGKAPIDSPKTALGSIKGGAVRLGPDQDWTKDGLLMIGEGIETCFSAVQAIGYIAWATLGTSGMEALQLLPEVKNIIILADGDEAGEKAAQATAARWKQEGRGVRIARPPMGRISTTC